MISLRKNGQIAVELFSDSPPGTFDVILMDMHMPVMGGVEAAKFLFGIYFAYAASALNIFSISKGLVRW